LELTHGTENEYDKERLQKIKMNQKLLLDLGIGKL
jgi:hypothetical protein